MQLRATSDITSTYASTSPGSTNASNSLLQGERPVWPVKRGCAPVGAPGLAASPSKGRVGTRGEGGGSKGGIQTHGRSGRDVSKTSEGKAVGHRVYKTHIRSPKAWKAYLTKLIYMCSFPLCSSTFNQVISFLSFSPASRMWCHQLTRVVQVNILSSLLERPLELTKTWETWGWR